MRQASDYFTDAERDEIRAAVTRAESGTSAEIVPVAATASGRYDRAEDIVGLWLGAIAAAAAWFLFPGGGESSGWNGGRDIWQLVVMLGALVGGFVIGIVLASHIGWLRRLFTPRSQLAAEVKGRAALTFFDQRIHHTDGGTGLVIYLSFYESRAVVLGDRDVEEKLGAGATRELCEQLTSALKSGESPAAALCKVIAEAGARLAKVLPREDGDQNELADALVCIDSL